MINSLTIKVFIFKFSKYNQKSRLSLDSLAGFVTRNFQRPNPFITIGSFGKSSIKTACTRRKKF